MMAGGIWVPLYGNTVGSGSLYGKSIFMPEQFGWSGAIMLTFIILAVFLTAAILIEKREETISSS